MIHTSISANDLTGHALDYAVALAQGIRPSMFIFKQTGSLAPEHRYSTDFARGGPIIDREGICLRAIRKPGHALDGQWLAMPARGDTGQIVQWAEFLFRDPSRRLYWKGPTMLVAAMRCFVGSNLGNHVYVPKELLS